MTIGIYALYWEEQDLIYIGQSINIEKRFKEHIRNITNNTHSNYKVLETYKLYGIPTLYTIEICSIEELNSKEIYWTKEFNSIEKGLNIIEAGQVGYGFNSNSSKYSKIQVLKVFSLLYKTYNTYISISKKLNVHMEFVRDISWGRSHLWLKEVYPEKYIQMIANRSIRTSHRTTAETLNIRYPIIVDPNGTEFKVTVLVDFCKNHPILSKNIESSRKCLGAVLRGDRKTWRGWHQKFLT